MTEERQPNTELRELAGKLAKKLLGRSSTISYDRECLAEELAAFAASIQAEAQQQIERLEKGIKAFKEYEECAERQIKGLEQQAEATEKQLAEARVQAFREAAEIARKWASPKAGGIANMVGLDIAAALERAAGATPQTVEAFEIHNRFCGENGEPCQVCRLKAEREDKK